MLILTILAVDSNDLMFILTIITIQVCVTRIFLLSQTFSHFTTQIYYS